MLTLSLLFLSGVAHGQPAPAIPPGGGGILPPEPTATTSTNPLADGLTTTTVTTTTTTTVAVPCPPAPLSGCRGVVVPGKSTLVLKLHPTIIAKDSLTWTWRKGDATAIEAFADPVGTAVPYRFCVYDATGEPQPRMAARIPTGGTCGSRQCWKGTPARAPKAYKFANPAATPNGVTRALVKGDTKRPGRAAIKLRGKGSTLTLPIFPIAAPVTAQLIVGEGAATACWEGYYPTATRSDGNGFEATGP